MTLEDITSNLLRLGFTARSKTTFQFQNVDVEIKDAFLKLNHPEIANLPDPFLRVKIFSAGAAYYSQFDCPVDSLQVFKNEQL